MTAYMICTTPRSGSTLLCTLLAQSGVAGAPDSHFHRPDRMAWLKSFGLAHQAFPDKSAALNAVLDAASTRGRGQSDVFGLRMQRGSFTYLAAQLRHLFPDAPTDIASLERAFGPTKLIYLSRRDKLAQAISRLIAEQTGLWHRNADGSERERQSKPANPCYDAKAIARHLAELQALDTEWEDWFQRQGLSPLRLRYEELSDAPQATLVRVLDYLGIDHDPSARIMPATARLAGELNISWAKRFRKDVVPNQ